MSPRYPARAVSLAAVAVIGLGLAACSSSGSSSPKSSSSGSAASSGLSKKNLELVVGTKSDDFYITMECGAEAEAKKLGAKLTVNGPADFSVSEQAPILNSVAATKPQFGSRGWIVPAALQAVSIIGWNSLLIIFFAKSATQLAVALGFLAPGVSRAALVPLLTLLGWYRGPNTTTPSEIAASLAGFLARTLPSSE